MIWVSCGIELELRKAFTAHWLHFNDHFYACPSTGDLIAELSHDAQRVGVMFGPEAPLAAAVGVAMDATIPVVA